MASYTCLEALDVTTTKHSLELQCRPQSAPTTQHSLQMRAEKPRA